MMTYTDNSYCVVFILYKYRCKYIITKREKNYIVGYYSYRFDGIIVVRNGGSYGAVSANWSISRNSSDRSPVSDDLSPSAGTVKFAAGQVTAIIPINIVADDKPEEAEAFVFKLLPNTVTGNAEVDEPMEVRLEEILSYPIRNIYLLFSVAIMAL